MTNSEEDRNSPDAGDSRVVGIERCSRCGAVAPPFDVGPDGAAAQGWITFAGEPELVINLPCPTEGEWVIDWPRPPERVWPPRPIPWEDGEPSGLAPLDFVLPLEVVEAIRKFDGLIRLVQVGPEVKVAAVGTIDSAEVGIACRECVASTGWDDMQWLMFLATEAS